MRWEVSEVVRIPWHRHIGSQITSTHDTQKLNVLLMLDHITKFLQMNEQLFGTRDKHQSSQ